MINNVSIEYAPVPGLRVSPGFLVSEIPELITKAARLSKEMVSRTITPCCSLLGQDPGAIPGRLYARWHLFSGHSRKQDF
ncbi:hypothetical protein TNCV_374071 [Trichonephila clavipes]|nr:hypothetical protein TNCV_374071 [Trichonephila clavipes]